MDRVRFPVLIASLMLASTTLAGCEVIGTIFKAGVWVGVIIIVVVLVVIGLIAKAVKK
jgi:hypothetical protein